MAPLVPRERLSFPDGDANAYDKARKAWNAEAAATKLPSAARRVAAVLADYLSFEHGHCWPSNEELAAALQTTIKTVNAGIAALDGAGLIERQTRVKRDEKGEAIGRERRIYLTRPEVNAPEVNAPLEGECTGREVNEPGGVVTSGECTYGGINTNDKDISFEDRALPHVYVRTHAGARVREIPSFPNRLSAGRWLGDFLFPGDDIFSECVDAAFAGTLTLDALARAQAVCYPASHAL